MSKKTFILILICILFLPLTILAQTEGIPIQKDVFLEYPIITTEDLPDQVTVALYDSATAAVPLATQTFARGKYTLDFEFNKSDGLASGSVARFKVNFTNKLNMGDDPDNPTPVKEIWAEIEINGEVTGDRTQVSDETMVQLLLASDASIATYLTLAYEGDDNPITTIYKDLPLSSASGSSANDYITSLFSTYSSEEISPASTTTPYWEKNVSDDNIYYNDGNVGIGTASPSAKLNVHGGGIFVTSSWGGNVLVGEGLGENEYGGYVWDAANNTLKFATASANAITFGHYNGDLERMRIDTAGSVGIGTASPAYTLAVNGSIGCKELTVTTSGWADFVFKDGYNLPPLEAIETFIIKNKHLPGIPSEAEVNENGVNVGKISAKLLQKIEELTLYIIALKKESDSLKSQLAAVQEIVGKTQK